MFLPKERVFLLSLFFACTSSILFFPQSDHTQTQLTLSRQRRDKYISTLYSMGSSQLETPRRLGHVAHTPIALMPKQYIY